MQRAFKTSADAGLARDARTRGLLSDATHGLNALAADAGSRHDAETAAALAAVSDHAAVDQLLEQTTRKLVRAAAAAATRRRPSGAPIVVDNEPKPFEVDPELRGARRNEAEEHGVGAIALADARAEMLRTSATALHSEAQRVKETNELKSEAATLSGRRCDDCERRPTLRPARTRRQRRWQRRWTRRRRRRRP